MAVTTVTTKMVAGVKYTVQTDSNVDWSGVSNSTYFYDLTDEVVYYKDGNGVINTPYTTITGGTYSSGTLTLNNNDGNTISVSGFTSGGGTSYWTETASAIKLDTAETTRDIVEINTGAAVTYGGNFSQGNLVVGDGHTFGGSSNTVRRSFIGGSSCTVGTTDSYEKSFGFGQSLNIQGDEDAVFGASNTVVGNRNFTANNGNTIYGTSNANLGESNIIGQLATPNTNTVTIGQSLTSHGDNQILIGKSFSTSVSTVKGIYIGLDGGRASGGFFQDALLGTGMNFAIGGDQTMRSLGVIQNGSGKGIFYLNNYTGNTISEPTVDIGDSVAMWAKKRSDDVVGLLVKDESGEKSWIGGRIGVGIIDPTEALEVSGNTVISGTLNVGSVGGTASVTNLGIDSSGNVVSGSTGPDSITFEIFNTSPASPDPYTIYDDGNIRLLFDEAATDDIEILILTNPSTGPVHVVWSEPTAGTSGSANVTTASGQIPLNTEVSADDVVDFVIWAPQDATYPYYEAKVTVSNGSFTSIPAVARVSKWNSPS